MVPMAMAPIWLALPIWPTMAISTMPNKGTVMLVMMLGKANRRICLFIFYLPKCLKPRYMMLMSVCRE